jgi:hypothetical protein
MAKASTQIEGLKEKGVVLIDDQPDVQLVTETDLATVARDEAFMHEVLEIMIFPTTDPAAPPYAQLNVNGDRAVVPRAVPVRVRRKHVEVLARMKETRVTQDMNPNREGEITTDNLRANTGLVYPFSVLKDPNPRGGAWLANVLAERG